MFLLHFKGISPQVQKLFFLFLSITLSLPLPEKGHKVPTVQGTIYTLSQKRQKSLGQSWQKIGQYSLFY